MVTLEQARHAKEELKSRLGDPEWLVGLGISKSKRGYCVQVNVADVPDAERSTIPDEIDGVDVRVESVGKIRPR